MFKDNVIETIYSLGHNLLVYLHSSVKGFPSFSSGIKIKNGSLLRKFTGFTEEKRSTNIDYVRPCVFCSTKCIQVMKKC